MSAESKPTAAPSIHFGSRPSRQRVDRLFEQAFGDFFGTPTTEEAGRRAWLPAVDVKETDDALSLFFELPGIKREDIEITVEDRLLTVRGERKFEKEAERERHHRVERSYGTFSRTFTLPVAVVADRAKASFADGVLRIELPKQLPRSRPPRDAPPAPPRPATTPEARPGVSLKQLHHPESGRLDARRIADYLDVPLKRLAEALGAKYTSVQKTPDARSLQPALQPIKRSLEILESAFGDRATVLAWWNSPHPDLGLRSPMELLLQGRLEPVAEMLEAARTGTPS